MVKEILGILSISLSQARRALSSVVECCQPQATTPDPQQTTEFQPTTLRRKRSGPGELVNRRLQTNRKTSRIPAWPTGTPVVNVILVAKQLCLASTGEKTNLMKANTTRNLTSVVMLVILSPFLALAMLVSIKTAGIRDNEVLLLLLTLSSAVLSGINGFGRRTVTSVPLTAPITQAGKNPSQGRISLSAHSQQ